MVILSAIWRFLVDFAQTIIIVGVIGVFIYVLVLQPHQVAGFSMFPTYNDKDITISYLPDVRFNNLKRGDVIVFHAPPDHEKLYIKRIVGLPGDSVRIQDGSVYLNNQLLDESSYLQPTVRTNPEAFLADGQTVVVPPDSIFAMGDNRPNSSDSRDFGFVTKDLLVGKTIARIWPLDTFEIIHNPFEVQQ